MGCAFYYAFLDNSGLTLGEHWLWLTNPNEAHQRNLESNGLPRDNEELFK